MLGEKTEEPEWASPRNMVGLNKKAKLACVFVLLVFVGSVSATRAVYAVPALALDGVGTNTTCQAPNCAAQLLTTTRGYDVIVLVAECGYGYCPLAISSIIDSSGLTFTQRISYAPGVRLWEYYARATSPLKPDMITVVFDQSYGVVGIQVLAIHSANTRAIFDPNPSIPVTLSCLSLACEKGVSIQTYALDFVIALTAISDNQACGGYYVPGYGTLYKVPGFSTIISTGSLEVDFAITTAPQTTVVFGCTGTDAIAVVVDAVSFRGAFGT